MAGEVRKTYLAMVRGWAPEAGVIDQPLRDKAMDRRDAAEQLLREAVTRFERVATTEIPVEVERYPASRYSLLRLMPETGRQHQLRRHLQHISHPIIGDTNYGRTRHNHHFAARFPPGRLMLAATTLRLDHPATGAPLTLQAMPEASFLAVLSVFGDDALQAIRALA